ncbi:MAG TPA: aldo/keto reductase [Bryobacteraceae bacterium]|nr:aldo/keto reductase [Bryobacteraceae bacterium]HOQ47324.1 aldo/keto reductase [Bryobacteraceae bacterium]HPU73891.1 aldo/keto reductase [Bryobacteraceae bacterium]
MFRREFLTRTTPLAAAAALGRFPYHLFAGTTKKSASDRVKLGPAQVEVSRLAMGTGTNGYGGSSNQTRKLGLSGVADLLQAAYDQGITFWDAADQYGTHPHLREGLKRVSREKVTILTKTRASTEKEMRADLDRFRRELNTDYIDILLLHCMMDANWTERKKGAMAVIEEARQKGIVKTQGASFHSLDALKVAAESPWLQVCLARINPAGVSMDADPQTVVGVLRQIKAAGKGVIGMKILGVGRLRNRADECLQYVLSLDCVDCFTIGSENRQEMADLVKRIPAASVRG